MIHNLKYKIAAILSSVALTLGFTMSLGSAPALAASGNQYCTVGLVACINAWGGGPQVNVYTSRGTTNNDFTVFSVNGAWAIKYTGNTGQVGSCIGDLGNDQGIARAGLVGCPTPGVSGGWGTYFDTDPNCGTNAFGFKNRHWGGWLKPNTFSNGAPFYLNSPTEYCFTIYPPA